MDMLDYFIVVTGAVLIFIGLYLFVAGKQKSDGSNNVEGFGIKLNVSNPSIILIVMGIGLVLAPRLLPNKPPVTAPLNQAITEIQKPVSSAQSIAGTGAQGSELPAQVNQSQPPPAQNTAAPPPQSIPEPSYLPRAFFPTAGNWYLNSYEENGIDLTANVSGSISFDSPSQSQLSWRANLAAMDAWGNGGSYFYQGNILAVGAGHQISVLNSNDPSFTRQAGLPLTLKMDPSGLLHMEYPYQGSHIIIHWRK